MTAEKDNKVYTISENEREQYEVNGFDIRDDTGNVISSGKGKTVPYEEYRKVVNELQALKESGSVAEDQFSQMTVEELKAFAEDHGIRIGNASSQAGIAKKIREVLEETY